ncbi:MAG: L-glyceraldehyde 3-phosphate reductase [Microbacteriaceae bacterium]
MSFTADSERYSSMPYVRCGNSGLLLPRVSLGLWNNFGDDRDFETQRAIVRRAFDRGVTHFDLANNYGPPPGSAEKNFGEILRQDFADYRDEMIISSKAGFDMWPGPYGEWGSRKYVLASLDQSLKRLGLDYVDIFYSHRPDPNTPMEETMGALVTALDSGRALYIGLSNYDAAQTTEALAILEDMGVPLLIHQPRYNFFDRRLEDGLLDVLRENRVGSIVYSPLAQGLATDRYLNGIPDDSRIRLTHWLDDSVVSDTYLDHVRALNDIAQQRGQSLAQMAVTWTLRHPEVTSSLVGASSVAQLDANLDAALAAPLTAEELAAIEPHAVHGLVDAWLSE